MDTAAASFRSTQAEFEWDNYEKVIDEVDDIQKGTIYYRRTGKEIEMMADVKMAGNDPNKLKPEPKYVLFSEGKMRMYQPKMDQVTQFDLGKNRADLETYVVLGFGGSGQDLAKTFDVTYVGPETINGVATAKLQADPQVGEGPQHLQQRSSVDRSRQRDLGAAAVLSTAAATIGWRSTLRFG